MMIFTSFGPAMIDLNRTSARAVEDLRHFIEFAERGPEALTAAVHGSVGGYESPFEQAVAEGLQRKGWETRPQIGVSRFRIDLGVVHPDRPGDYLVGVECDGATYHSAATARDRDKVRAEILCRLGWKLIRVWSTEWWVNREGALARLDQAIRTVLEQSRQTATLSEPAGGVDVPARGTLPAVVTPESAHDRANEGQTVAAEVHQMGSSDATPQVAPLLARPSDRPVGTAGARRGYRTADLSDLRSAIDPEAFHESSYDSTLESIVQRVLEQEAPILDKALVDRVARAHRFKRSGRLIRERVLSIARHRYHFEPDPQPEHGEFIWVSPDDPERWNTYRTPEPGADVRQLDAIPQQEIRAAARTVHGEDVPLQITRIFGLHRLSAAARERVEVLLQP